MLYLLIWFVWWPPKTRLGRAMRAVRDNELAAETIGLETGSLTVEGTTSELLDNDAVRAAYLGGHAA